MTALHPTVAAALEAARAYARQRFAPAPFEPGKTHIPASGKWFDEDEVAALVDASLDFWLTAGRYADAFEAQLAERVGARFAFFVNSGSSANLLALSALTAPKLGERALKAGDDIFLSDGTARLKVLRAKYLVPATGLNKIKGQPFKVSEIEAGVEAILKGGK